MEVKFTKKLKKHPSGTYSVIVPIDVVRANQLEYDEYYEFGITVNQDES